MKTRVIALGYYEDLNADNLHYILETKNEKNEWEKWLDFFSGNSFYIDDIPIEVLESTTRTGKKILTFNYEINDRLFTVPMFHNFTGRFALTSGALKNGLFHYNKPLSKLDQCLIDKDISIRCIRYVENKLELDTIYNNIQEENISPLFMKYLLNHKIRPKKLVPKEYQHSFINPLPRDEFEKMKQNGFMIIEKTTKEDNYQKARTIPSIIFIVKSMDKESLIEYLDNKYANV